MNAENIWEKFMKLEEEPKPMVSASIDLLESKKKKDTIMTEEEFDKVFYDLFV